ncbi:MAG: DUF368 domain-containing protein [Chlorobi bacterium]|nr:DUF368 domain-containing protein [Chlorobiota bacterium]
MKEVFSWFIKGFGIGAANVIPGVSGGTVALITGIFERLIDALKSFNLKSLKLLIEFKFKEFAKYTDLLFLVSVFGGAVVSIFTFARLLAYLFDYYPVFVWSYFFGLILASVYFVGKTIDKINLYVIITFVAGTAIAIWISLQNPAAENDAFLYLVLCGIIAIISMILPGLSGSFILVLMGNYQLVMINSVNSLDFHVLLPVALGVVIGLPAFSNVLSWIYKKYKNETIASLTGFILGSLIILWPWKHEQHLIGADGLKILKANGEPVVSSYIRYLPDSFNSEVILAAAFLIFGILSVWAIEHFAKK